MKTATQTESADEQHIWQRALRILTPLNRVHAGPDMMEAYDALCEFYPQCERISYQSGDISGTWQAPPGWKVNKAKLTAPDGNVIADFDQHKMSVFLYAPAFEGQVSLSELQNHLMSDQARPDIIPFHFRNQYNFENPQWGFCIPETVRQNLQDGDYNVDIDTQFTDDPLEMVLHSHKGKSDESFLLVGHFDHPEQCGDGLLGCIAGHEVISRLKDRKTKLTYRMLSTVEIVGSVFYCERRAKQDNIKLAMFSAVSGIDAPLLYAGTAKEKHFLDRAMRHLIKHVNEDSDIIGFRDGTGIGNDETAFDVAGIDIPCGSLMRWPHPHYHSSEDTPDKVNEEKFESFISCVLDLIDIFENNAILTAKFTGLPRLSHPDIDLYLSPPTVSFLEEEPNHTTRKVMQALDRPQTREIAFATKNNFSRMMNLLPSFADGAHTTLDLAEQAEVPFSVVNAYTDLWVEKGLLEKTWVNPFQDNDA